MPYFGYGRSCHIFRPICCRPSHQISCRPHCIFPCCRHCGHGFRRFSAGVVLGILFGCI